MKRTITIAPLSREKKATVILHGKYTNKKAGILVNILMDGNVISEECQGVQKTKNITINDQKPEFIFTWDDETDAKGILEAHSWTKAPDVDAPGNDNLQRAMFKLVDKTEMTFVDVKLLKQKGRVYNIINGFSVKKMRDIAFFEGLNPIHQSPDEIFLKLVDFEKGVLMQKPEGFLNHISTPDMDYIVIGKKAILYDVIQTKDSQYFINTELIGGSFNDVLAYCKGNKQQFEYIKKEVEKLDVLPIDIDYDKTVNEITGTVQMKTDKPAPIKDDIEKAEAEAEGVKTEEKEIKIGELRAIAKNLKIKSYQVMGVERLVVEIEKVKIKEALPELAEKEEEFA